MRDGSDVSIDSLWRGTMMANSSRDPYWQASVRAETLSNPDYNEIIQDKCSQCAIRPWPGRQRLLRVMLGFYLTLGSSIRIMICTCLALDGISVHPLPPD